MSLRLPFRCVSLLAFALACGESHPTDDSPPDGGPDAVVCVECPAPAFGCRYVGASCETCGELVCETCGGLGGGTCGTTEYCDYDAGCGFADGTGVCRSRPEGCPEDCPGVCGCDGMTYCNACIAASMGVDVLREGSCGPPPPTDTCGGSSGAVCGVGEWCDFGGCPAPGAAGVCQVRPEICEDIFMPVCGCDGMTYGNACEAEAAGVNIAGDGACGP